MRKKTSFKMKVEATFTFNARPSKSAMKTYLTEGLTGDGVDGFNRSDKPIITKVTVQSITG